MDVTIKTNFFLNQCTFPSKKISLNIKFKIGRYASPCASTNSTFMSEWSCKNLPLYRTPVAVFVTSSEWIRPFLLRAIRGRPVGFSVRSIIPSAWIRHVPNHCVSICPWLEKRVRVIALTMTERKYFHLHKTFFYAMQFHLNSEKSNYKEIVNDIKQKSYKMYLQQVWQTSKEYLHFLSKTEQNSLKYIQWFLSPLSIAPIKLWILSNISD